MPTLQLLQDVQTRLERGGGGGKDREQRGRNEGGREGGRNVVSRPACMGVSSLAVGGSLSSKNKCMKTG